VQHGVLRKLLAGYMGCEPRQVDIRTNTNGKPYLACPDSAAIQFSVSHSDGLAVYALSRIDSIGVDIEKICQFPDMLEIVEEQFTLREKQEILSCPEDRRLLLFYRFWTRKEAVLKAQGEGLLKALNSVDVVAGEGPGPWKVGVPVEAGVEEYSVLDVEGPAHFAAAVALAGPLVGISVQHHMIKEI
jgi:4'-phosphopantetheinyl transferase